MLFIAKGERFLERGGFSTQWRWGFVFVRFVSILVLSFCTDTLN